MYVFAVIFVKKMNTSCRPTSFTMLTSYDVHKRNNLNMTDRFN